MPQLDQMSFVSQVFWFLLTYYTLYSFILIYLLPPIFRILKYRTKKFELLINQINFLNLSTTDGDKKYIHFLKSLWLNDHIQTSLTNNSELVESLAGTQVEGYLDLEKLSEKSLEQIIFRKINL